MTTEAPSEVVAVIARMDAIELRWRKHEGRRVVLAAIVKNNQTLLDAASEKLRGQEVPEMKLAGGIRDIRADLMAAMRDLAEHDTRAVDIQTEIDEIRVEVVRLREKYGPGII